MLRLKVYKILNEKFRDQSNVHFAISGTITLDNWLTRAGSSIPRCEVGLGAGCVQGTNPLHTHPGQVSLTA
jgi:hypothetical protein